MLEVIVFTCGAALMGLEFLAARMLAPTLGSSLFVWGSVISIVMVALSLGYWAGGSIADRYGSSRVLAPVIAFAGFTTVLIPSLAAFALPRLAPLGTRAGSLAASAIVFFLPSLLLAMVSPLGVRLATGTHIDRVGRSAGQLYAISTAGSIAGTIATAFWLIPLLSLDGLVVGIAFLLFGTSLAAALLPNLASEPAPEGRRVPPAVWAGAAGAILLGSAIGIYGLVADAPDRVRDPLGGEVIFRRDTQYHRLTVTDEGDLRLLRFDRSRQSSMYLDRPYDTSFSYPNYLHLPLALKPDARRVLIVGLGGGSLVKRMWRDYPEMTIDVVEIDPVVVDVAERYFELPDDERIITVVEDGRRYLRASDETYDIIVMDAYYADALPAHLTTVEFFREAKARLAPDGVLAYNVISSLEGDRSKLFRSMYRTADTVWDELLVFPVQDGGTFTATDNRNIVVLATDSKSDMAELRQQISSRVSGRVTVPGFETFGDNLYEKRVPVSDVPLLTDQHAPTDSLIEVN